MGKIFRKVALTGIVLLLSLSLASLSLAVPPGLARKADSEKHQIKTAERFVPPGLQERLTPPGLADKGTPPGLADKGGLPPGLHGRSLEELPPGIRYNPNFQEAINRLKEKEQEQVFNLTVVGSESIIIPNEDPLTTIYKAFFKDSDDNAEALTASWELSEAQTGVSIDENGVLEVTPSAESGTINVLATYFTTGDDEEEIKYSGSLAVELYKQEVGEIKLSGQEFYILQENEEETLQFEYTATVKDQEGEVMEADVSWSTTSTDYQNMTTSVNGTLVVEIPAAEGTFTVKASANGVEATLLVTIYSSNVASVEITGPQLIALTDTDETSLSLEYAATVKDQHGRIMEEENVSWSTTSTDFSGITIKVNGTLIVEVPATDGEFTVKATSGDITGTLTATVYTPEIASIEIIGENYVPLQEDDEELFLKYAATAKDQKGRVMEDIELVWSADDIAGLVLDNGDITLIELPAQGDELVFNLTVEYIFEDEVLERDTITATVYHPVVDSIFITGVVEITLPDEDEVTKEYKAVILDQHGQKTEAEVAWLMAEEDGSELTLSGVELDNGVLTVTSDAEAESIIWIWAVYSEEIYDFLQVDIV